MAQQRISSQEPHEMEADYDDVTSVLSDQEKREAEINAELGAPENGADYLIKVYRVPPNGKNLIYLFDTRGETVQGLLNTLRDDYGSGTYTARVYKNSKLHRVLPFEIEVAKPKQQAQPDHGGSALVTAVAKQGELLGALVGQLAAIKQAPPVSPPAADFAGMAAMIEAVRGLMPPPPPPPPAQAPFEMLASVMGFVKDLQDDGREKGMFDILGEFLKSPLIEKVVSGAAQPQLPAPQNPPRPTQPQIQQPQPAAPQPPAPTAAPDPANDMPGYLLMLADRAAKNSDPVLWADVMADVVPREMIEQLLMLPDPFAAMAQVQPAIVPHREWFVQMLEALTQPDDGEISDAVNPASAADVSAGNRPASVPASRTT